MNGGVIRACCSGFHLSGKKQAEVTEKDERGETKQKLISAAIYSFYCTVVLNNKLEDIFAYER